jgi:hypothetical protein
MRFSKNWEFKDECLFLQPNHQRQSFRHCHMAAFATNLKTTDIPDHVLRKTEDLWVDWFGSAIAGHAMAERTVFVA